MTSLHCPARVKTNVQRRLGARRDRTRPRLDRSRFERDSVASWLFARLRALARGEHTRSDDPRKVARILDRELQRLTSPGRDGSEPVQFIGITHTVKSYWRAAQIARMPDASVPVVPAERWPLVLWVMRPANAPEVLRRGRAQGLYAALQVGHVRAGS